MSGETESPPEGGPAGGKAGISMVETLTVSGYTADRATRNTLRAAGRVLGLPPRVLAGLPRGELRRLLRQARGRLEREWHRASLRLDAVIAMEDAIREGRL